jgi:hypothetical protein
MAKNAATGSGTGNHVIGKVFIIYGTVKAVASDGTVRILAPNSPVFADEKIITDSDGSVSIMLDGTPPTQLDLGRMTEIVLDEDVYGGAAPEAVTEATAEAQQIQQTLLQGDQPIELEATAAGGAAGAGGGHPIVIFGLTGEEVTPGSGAGTTGITTTGADTLGGALGAPAAPLYGVVTLTGTDSISEDGGTITYTAAVDNAPQGSDLVLTLNNGEMITIPAGQTTGSTDYTPAPDPDVYVDPGSIPGDIVSAEGGGYTGLELAGTVTTAVYDSIDITTVTLSAPESVTENVAGVTFTATLSHPGETAVTVHTDHGDIVIAAGDTQGTLFISTENPDVYVDPSSITATVTGVDGGNYEAVDYSQASATAQITDTIDTTTVSLSGPESVNEGGSAAYTVSVDHVPQTDMTVNVSYSYISAETNDIVTNTTQVTIQAGQTSAQFSVDAVDDQIFEGTETFAVSISDPQGGNFENLVLGNASVETDILDEGIPTVSISDGTPNPATEGTNAAITFTVTLSNAADHDMTVAYGTADGTALAGSDYTATSGTITFAAGETSHTVTVPVIDDTVFENPEAFTVQLGSTTGGVAVSDGSGIGNIIDNDAPPPPPENHPPLDADETYSMTGSFDGPYFYPGDEGGGTITGNALLNASDSDGDPLTVSDGTGTMIEGQYGYLTLASNGNFTYTLYNYENPGPGGQETPPPEGPVTETFNYTVSDGQGGTNDSSITITLTVGEFDDVPTLETSGAEIDETDGLGSVSGTLAFAYGADGPGTIALSADGASWNADTLTLTATDWKVVVNDDSTYTFTQLAAIDHPDADNPDDAANITFTATVTDADNDSVSQDITVAVHDDGPTAYDVHDSTQASQITINTGNTDLATGIGAGGMVHIIVDAPGDDHGHATLNFNSNEDGSGTAFGITSDHDGNASYSAEINYLGTNGDPTGTASEVMIFELQNDSIATHATVDINVFYKGESGVGDEIGAYELYNNHVMVQGATTFTANSTGGHFQLDINGPEGGFDEIHFSARSGTADNPGGDSSDYNVKSITFNLVPENETGNLLTDSTPEHGSFGADGGHVDSIAGVGGGTTDSDHSDGLMVTGKYGGTLDVDSNTGDYLYTPPTSIPTGDVHETFSFTLIDGDGDTSSAQLDMLIDDPNTPHP